MAAVDNRGRPNITRDEYDAALPMWVQVEDACAGEMAVKKAREIYLPKPNAQDLSKQNVTRYDSYVARAVYYNASGRTLGGLLGMAFSKPPEIKVPAGMEGVLDDVDGAGVKLVQQSQQAVANGLKQGRAGLLTDYPVTQRRVSRADITTGGVQPTILLYKAQSILNWRTEQRGGKSVLTLVVLAETHEEPDGFALKVVKQCRVLKLNPFYVVEIWRETDGSVPGTKDWTIVETLAPTDGSGKSLTEIPFAFIGAQNNDWTIDDPPLYDLTCVNLAHYRNSADYEDSVYFCGQPQIWMAGLSEEWRDHLEKQGIYVGSRVILPLPENGSAGIVQANPNTLAHEAMMDKEKQMAALGARLIQEGTVAKTATQQDSEDAVAQSVLTLVCENVSAAYTKALTWYAAFANVTGEIVFKIGTEFAAHHLNPEELRLMMELLQGGKLPNKILWQRMRLAGLIPADMTDDQVQEAIDADPPPRDPEGGDPNDNRDDDPPGD